MEQTFMDKLHISFASKISDLPFITEQVEKDLVLKLGIKNKVGELIEEYQNRAPEIIRIMNSVLNSNKIMKSERESILKNIRQIAEETVFRHSFRFPVMHPSCLPNEMILNILIFTNSATQNKLEIGLLGYLSALRGFGVVCKTWKKLTDVEIQNTLKQTTTRKCILCGDYYKEIQPDYLMLEKREYLHKIYEDAHPFYIHIKEEDNESQKKEKTIKITNYNNKKEKYFNENKYKNYDVNLYSSLFKKKSLCKFHPKGIIIEEVEIHTKKKDKSAAKQSNSKKPKLNSKYACCGEPVSSHGCLYREHVTLERKNGSLDYSFQSRQLNNSFKKYVFKVSPAHKRFGTFAINLILTTPSDDYIYDFDGFLINKLLHGIGYVLPGNSATGFVIKFPNAQTISEFTQSNTLTLWTDKDSYPFSLIPEYDI